MYQVLFNGRRVGTGETLKSVQAKAFEFIKSKVYDIDKISFSQYHNATLGYRQLQARARLDRNIQRILGVVTMFLIIGSVLILALILKGGF